MVRTEVVVVMEVALRVAVAMEKVAETEAELSARITNEGIRRKVQRNPFYIFHIPFFDCFLSLLSFFHFPIPYMNRLRKNKGHRILLNPGRSEFALKQEEPIPFTECS